jgi:prepilin-type N-terminal cleavage/methylation domain-containing protein
VPCIVEPTPFTLIELLVVISIIALLIAILLPALSQAQQTAKQTQCLANIRSLGMATLSYVDIFKGRLPVRANGSASDLQTFGSSSFINWNRRLTQAGVFDFTKTRSDVGPIDFRHCPEVRLKAVLDDTDNDFYSTYTTAPDITGDWNNGTQNIPFRILDNIRNPSKIFM